MIVEKTAEIDRHHQIAALPWRKHNGRVEILLITSRETKRWVIPKGWPMKGRTDYNAAKREAFEEAGVEGRISTKSLGSFDYEKRTKKGGVKPCRVMIYPLEISTIRRNWPEKSERQRAWFKVEDAVAKVVEQGLKQVIASLA
jgi:8-oxo-dGTP pyrophosphatase MutT (NUDIX family)